MQSIPHFNRLIAKWRLVALPRDDHFLRRFFRDRTTSNLRQFHSEITVEQRGLLEFGQQSGDEFTALAESVTTLDTGLHAVGIQATKLNDTLQDRDEDRALFSAFELYKKSVDLAHASIGIALSQEEQMAQIEGSLLQNRGTFSRNGLMFRVIVMNIRAEAARVDPENQAIFNSVAGEIATMQQQLMKTVEGAFEELETIVDEAIKGRGQLHELKAELHQNAQQSIKLLRGELDGIKLSLVPCATASERIVALLAETRTQTGNLIVSLQYQDIVRQQLEHVSQGFDDLSAHLKPQDSNKLVDGAYLHHAAKVQQAHLARSRRAIETAAAQIKDGCARLANTGAELAEIFSEMQRAAGVVFQDSRVGELFSKETENLVKVASTSEVTNVRIGRLLERIEKSITIFSTEIGRYEFDVQLIALNGQIAAARVPDAGALNKLAEFTSELAADTTALTRSMTAKLRETLGRLNHIRQEAEVVKETIGREKIALAQGTVVVREKIERLQRHVKSSSTGLACEFTDAYERVRDLLPSLRFPGLIDQCFGPAEQLCTQLLNATADFEVTVLSEEGSNRLAEHKSRYTMQGERDAHVSAAYSQSAAPSRADPDDIELFDDSNSAPVVPASAPAAEASDGVELF